MDDPNFLRQYTKLLSTLVNWKLILITVPVKTKEQTLSTNLAVLPSLMEVKRK